MTHTHPEAQQYAEAAPALIAAAGNLIDCHECGGAGETMAMVCYGGPPHEVTEWCQACDGTGKVLP